MKLIHGFGINDAGYTIKVNERVFDESGNFKIKEKWICPYYYRWQSMIHRCYSETYLKRFPTYRGCRICNEWKYFSNFKKWMEEENWEGLYLDKDLLIRNNKIYTPNACVFVSSKINSFLVTRNKSRGAYPLGVTLRKETGRYRARVYDIDGKLRTVGNYDTPLEAHRGWQLAKIQLAHRLKDLTSSGKVREGLDRVIKDITFEYENGIETEVI